MKLPAHLMTFGDVFCKPLRYSNTKSLLDNIQECWQVLSPTKKETSYSDRRFWFSCILFTIIIGGILVLFIYTGVLISP